MNTSKKYLLIVNALKAGGTVKNCAKAVLRGGDEEALRKGLTNFIRKEIESSGIETLKDKFNLLPWEMIEEEIKTAIDNWELYPSPEKLYQKDYLYEPEPGDSNSRVEYFQVKNIIKLPLLESEYEIYVREVTDDSRLSTCQEVIVMSKDVEEIFTLEYPEIINVKDATEEKDEKIVYDNGYYETICKSSSEMEEHLLCWKREVLKVEECQ